MKTRVPAAAVIVALSVTIAACGSSPKGGLTPSTGTLGSTTTSPQDQGAGTIASVTPAGTMIADNGFRPNPDGFGFQNYGDNLSVDGTGAIPTNLTPADMQTFFGTQVCSSGSGSSCVLIPTAKAWMDQENKGMAGGHCFGFSVAALRVYSGNLKTSDLGSGAKPFELTIPDNTGLQTSLAANWAGQDLPLERDAVIKGSPNDVLNKAGHRAQGQERVLHDRVLQARRQRRSRGHPLCRCRKGWRQAVRPDLQQQLPRQNRGNPVGYEFQLVELRGRPQPV